MRTVADGMECDRCGEYSVPDILRCWHCTRWGIAKLMLRGPATGYANAPKAAGVYHYCSKECNAAEVRAVAAERRAAGLLGALRTRMRDVRGE